MPQFNLIIILIAFLKPAQRLVLHDTNYPFNIPTANLNGLSDFVGESLLSAKVNTFRAAQINLSGSKVILPCSSEHIQ